MRGLILILTGLPLAVWAGADDLEITDAQVPESKAGSSAAISMFLQNTSSSTLVITGARSPVAGQTLVQRYVKGPNGLVQLKPLAELVIPAGRDVLMTPGVLELRLVGLRRDLETGLEIPLTFKFANGELRTVRIAITGQ